ncbi:hypothetical protein FOA52_006781 [Chlamydomonas sp. UWO 241]|nr:hypothetical protein FOA52_006781 [Chlamydomonas sp. UWO 241]
MVKAYLRYEAAGTFGVVASSAAPEFSSDGKQLYSPALENVGVWNVKQGTLVSSLMPSAPSTSSAGAVAEVTVLTRAPHAANVLAAGYSDGTVRLWDLGTNQCSVTLKGHKAAVTALRFNASGSFLASGSRDTDLILWDVVGETGLYRLRGHKDQVTDLVFVTAGNRLVSCSKDGLLKVWDLSTQHCCETLSGYKAEIWSLDLDPSETRLVTGATDHELRVYAVAGADGHHLADDATTANGGGATAAAAAAAGDAGAEGGAGVARHSVLRLMGSVKRTAGGSERVTRLRFDEAGGLLAVMGTGKSIELFRVRSGAEASKRLKRRKKRRREKAQKKGKGGADGADGGDRGDEDDEPAAADELEPFKVISLKSKIRSFAFAPSACLKALRRSGAKGGGDGGARAAMARLAVSTTNNAVEVVDLLVAAGVEEKGEEGGPDAADVETESVQKLEQAGHRADIRTVCLSGDDQLMLSGSNSAVKVWNPTTGACLSTMESGYTLSSLFAPGGSHAVVGTKEGKIEVFDLGASTRVHIEDAHEGPVWSLCALPDRTGFVSGSADKTVKFWQWKVVVATDGAKTLKLQHTRTLKMADDVLCVRVSPDGKLLAASLLDATIKVFFVDSLKFFLSLYGHKLPVLCMDISSDSTLLVSGSADKNMKVWGLDFGDCHKSLFAHQDTVMQLAFVHNTHYCFSVGKDRMLKYWDVDRQEMLLEMPGHHAEVWALAVSAYGDFVVTGSHDRSLRRWERTQEPFFVEEEKEKRLESLFEADMEAAERTDDAAADKAGEGGSVAPAGRKTLDSVGAADSIVESLEMAAHEAERRADAKKEAEKARNAALASGASASKAASAAASAAQRAAPPNPLMLGLGPGDYVARAVSGVKPADLESALLMLPFSDALRLLSYLPAWLFASGGSQTELATRVAVLLLRLHHTQLVATAAARPVMVKLRRSLRPSVQGLKDTAGFNLAALRHLQRQARERSGVAGETDALTPAKRALAKR